MIPLKITSFDRSIVGRLVGTVTGGGRTVKPFGGAGATILGSSGTLTTLGAFGFGASLGGGGSFFGGGGSSFFTSTKLTFVSRGFSAFLAPARAVAKTARNRTTECKIMLKRVPAGDLFFLSGLDSISLTLLPC